MADIDNLETIIKKSDDEKPSKKGKKTVESKSQKTRTSLNDKQWDLIKYVFVAIILTLLMGFVGVFASYLQVVHDAYQEYTKTLRDYNDLRYEKLDSRVKDLEMESIASPSTR